MKGLTLLLESVARSDVPHDGRDRFVSGYPAAVKEVLRNVFPFTGSLFSAVLPHPTDVSSRFIFCVA